VYSGIDKRLKTGSPLMRCPQCPKVRRRRPVLTVPTQRAEIAANAAAINDSA